MINENLSIILKYAGSILSGFYGIYATLTNFRADKDGKRVLTMKGYVGIALLFLSTMLSLSTNAIKDIQDYKDKIRAAVVEKLKADEARAREHEVMERLNRQLKLSEETSSGLTKQLGISTGISDNLDQAATSIEQNAHATRNLLSATDILMHPIKDVRFTFLVKVPINNSHLKLYMDRLKQGLRNLLPKLDPDGEDIDNIRVVAVQNKTPKSLLILPGSSLLPNNSEPLEKTALSYADVELNFYKNSIDPREYSKKEWRSKHLPDLRIAGTTGFQEPGKDGGPVVIYDLQDHELLLGAFEADSNPKYWVSNGRIRGLPDLLRSQVVIRLPNFIVERDKNANRSLQDVRSKFELHTLALRMSDGREFKAFEFRKYVDDTGFLFYTAKFSDKATK